MAATAHTPPMPKKELAGEFLKNMLSHVTDNELGYLTPIEHWAKMVEGGGAALEASCGARRGAIAGWVAEFKP